MINETVGKYKITRLIGEGGMASVYEAEHEMLGTKVAIKVLNPILSANAQIRERFKNEAKMMASFNHPNITKIIDFDDQPHQLSIVMEFLEGEDLNEKIKRNGPLSQDALKDIFTQTLSAFQYAHEKGVVHRDIKPSNIYVLPNGHVKILDFGIAKLFGQGNEMTQTGTQMGTPIYMSPEQVRADKSIDHRSDIYSLGVTMYFAITGKPPYNADTTSQFDIFNKIVYEPIPEISTQNNLNLIVSKACSKHREERFQTCFEFLQAFSLPSLNPESNEKTIIDEKYANIKQEEKTILTVDPNSSNQNFENWNFQNTTNSKNNKRNRVLILSVFTIIVLGIWGIFNSNNKTTDEKNDNVSSSEKLQGDTVSVANVTDTFQLSDLSNNKRNNKNNGTVTIGSQVWMTKNLSVNTFRNGDPIPEAKSNEEWEAAGKNKQPAWCYYNNDPANRTNYGKLYNWFAVNDPRGIAPEGWRVPSKTDFDKLYNISGKASSIHLKSEDSWLNEPSNAHGTNNSGFNGLASGYRTHEGNYMGKGLEGSYWSANETENAFAWRIKFSNTNEFQFLDILKSFGFSVRCLRD